jgi:hypothetical protein
VLIPRKSLILPQSRESAEVQAQSYSLGAHRPYSARTITNWSVPGSLNISSLIIKSIAISYHAPVSA